MVLVTGHRVGRRHSFEYAGKAAFRQLESRIVREFARPREGLPVRSLPVLVLAATLMSNAAVADDGAASIAAGGIVMTREPRITMAKEILFISVTKVKVDYDFRNDTDSDITTEVAFPVPAYKLAWDEFSIREQGFDDFRLEVQGMPVHFDIEAKAKLKGRDVSETLRKYGIDIATFGHFNEDTHYARDVRRLSATQRAALVKAGLIDSETDQDEAIWSVEKKYYWQQTFPAHSVVHISHQYTPALGDLNSVRYGLMQAKEDPSPAKQLDEFCLDPGLRSTLTRYVEKPSSDAAYSDAPYSWVDFILTTANTWKTPIEDFTLIIERDREKGAKQSFVSFCWDGPVTKTDADHFSAHVDNFVPKQELHIGFFSVY